MCVIFRPHHAGKLMGQSFPLSHTAGMLQKTRKRKEEIIGPNT
jgi:hypothetical protein